jgi:hypothetical protein
MVDLLPEPAVKSRAASFSMVGNQDKNSAPRRAIEIGFMLSLPPSSCLRKHSTIAMYSWPGYQKLVLYGNNFTMLLAS